MELRYGVIIYLEELRAFALQHSERQTALFRNLLVFRKCTFDSRIESQRVI